MELRQYLKALNVELDKYFDPSEKDEILSYYEELIRDRMDQGEKLDHILIDYPVHQVVRKMMGRYWFADDKEKPEHKEAKKSADEKNTKRPKHTAGRLIYFLFVTPVLIPVGIIYIASWIAIIAVIFAIIVTMIACIGTGLWLLFDLFTSQASAELMIGSSGILLLGIGAGLIAFSIVYQVIKILMKSTSMIFVGIARSYGK